jgi:hypothetical protein
VTVSKRSTWIAWLMLAVFVVSLAVAVLLAVANRNLQRDPGFYLALIVAFTAFMAIGALIVAHRPENRVGWIFAAVGLLAALGTLATEYAQYAYLTRPGSLPGGSVAAWYEEQWWYPMLLLILVFIPLVFPTGRLLSARWCPVAAAAALVFAVLGTMTAFQPTVGLQNQSYTVRNPIALAWVPDPEHSGLGSMLFVLAVVCGAAAVGSLVVRFRRSWGAERQQLKWFTYAAVLAILLNLATDYLPLPLASVLFGLTLAAVPIAAGLAILRYRLYEIDRLINRTLVYGLLTGIFGLVYAGAVLLLGQLFGGVGGNPPSWAVAGATLAVAALFQPVRRRIQAAVDRRFNRRRYDATRTVAAFSARLRHEVDLEDLSAELLAVVDQTMQPTQASLWLRPPPA